MQQRNLAVPRADAATWDRLTAADFTLVTADGRLLRKAARLAELRTQTPDTATPRLGNRSDSNTAVQRYRPESFG
jgi:hypothetical protein